MPSAINALKEKLSCAFGYDHVVMLGRARSGYAALVEILSMDMDSPLPVLIPENICPAVATAIRAGGGRPVTVPVSAQSGLPDDDVFAHVLKGINQTGIFSPAHLYGFQGDYPKTLKLAHEKGWFILENDSNAIRMNCTETAFGDGLLVSFGYAKPIEAGSGGVFFTNDPALAQDMTAKVADYKMLDDTAHAQEEGCMLQRRKLRHKMDVNSPELRHLCKHEESLSRFSFNESQCDILMKKLSEFPIERNRRLALRHMWDQALKPLNDIFCPVPLKQPVPWRLIRSLAQKRDIYADILRQGNIDAGINYRSLWRELPADYLSGQPTLPDLWGDRVLNLWLTDDYDSRKIEKAANFLEKAAYDL